MDDDAIASSLYAGLLMIVAGGLAWISGRPFIFPSLGPSAYMLATTPRDTADTSRQVVGGHLVGVVAGLLSYHLLAAGLVVTSPTGMLAFEQLRLACSGVASVVLTSGGMMVTDTSHPPACATTLIVSLGLLSSPTGGGIILISVVVLYSVYSVTRRLHPIGE